MNKLFLNPVFGMVFFIGVIAPLLVFFLLRRFTELKALALKIWLFSYGLGFLFFPIFIFRKHWEAQMVFWKNNFWFVTLVVQMDNNFWEELAKLLVLLITFWVFKEKIKRFFQKGSSSLFFGYWTGLGYGVGEAITLMLAILLPRFGRIIGLNLFLAFVTWMGVYERFLAIQIHAIMGALVGVGIYFWYKEKSWTKLIIFFIMAMLYHELVDGTVLYIGYFSSSDLARFVGKNLMFLILPAYVIFGYLILVILLILLRRRKESDPANIIEQTNINQNF